MVLFAVISCISGISRLAKPEPSIQLAIAARVYFSPSSHRTSQHTIYLCDLHGGHLRKLKGLPNHYSNWIELRWADSYHLQWQGSVVHHGYETGEVDLRTGRIKIQKRANFVDGFDSERKPFSSLDTVRSVDPLKPGSVGIVGAQDYQWVYTNGDVKVQVPTLDGTPIGMYFEPKLNRLWLLDHGHDSTLGTRYGLSIFDWSTHKLKPVFQDVSCFDFRIGRDIYAATATRDLSDYGKKKSVWTALPIVGNWKTGKSWFPMKGLVYATGIAIRP